MKPPSLSMERPQGELHEGGVGGVCGEGGGGGGGGKRRKWKWVGGGAGDGNAY